MKDLIDQLKSIYGIFSLLGTIIPGFSFFLDFAPPLFSELSLITSALAVIVFVLIARSHKVMRPQTITIMVACSVVILILYLFLFRYTTLKDPDSDKRYQIGFYAIPFSLTPTARTMVAENLCYNGDTPNGLIMCVEGSLEERIDRIWGFSVVSAGLILIVLFISSSLLWVASFCYLAKANKTKI